MEDQREGKIRERTDGSKSEGESGPRLEEKRVAGGEAKSNERRGAGEKPSVSRAGMGDTGPREGLDARP